MIFAEVVLKAEMWTLEFVGLAVRMFSSTPSSGCYLIHPQ